MSRPHLYLDYQAATPLAPEVTAAMQPWLECSFGNPSSGHALGLAARGAIDLARAQLAQFLGVSSPDSIIFTGSGTEAVNLAIKGTVWSSRCPQPHIIVSAIEHPAVLRSVQFLEQHGYSCTRVPVDPDGWLPPDRVRAALTENTVLIAVHHANHDVGTLEPIAEIAAIAQDVGVPFFVDAVASAGWVPLAVETLGVSLLALSPRRFYGPPGVGVLYRSPRARLTPLVHGGEQEGGRHAGTENVPAIVGAGVAAELATQDLPTRSTRVAALQAQLWEGLRAGIPQLRLNGPPPGPRRVPHTLNVSIEGVEGEGVMLKLDLEGVAIAAGAACVSRATRVPPVLRALGLDPAQARGNILLSLGRETTGAEVDRAVASIARTVAQLREQAPAGVFARSNPPTTTLPAPLF